MTDKKRSEHNEQEDTLRDLDVREEQAEEVKGGLSNDPPEARTASATAAEARSQPATCSN